MNWSELGHGHFPSQVPRGEYSLAEKLIVSQGDPETEITKTLCQLSISISYEICVNYLQLPSLWQFVRQ